MVVEARDAQVAYSCTRASCTPSLQATGVQTGNGNDVIVNDGTISTAIVAANGARSLGTSISSGGGNDEVTLGVGSNTAGAVLLGAGDDTLVWSSGATLTGGADGSVGTDRFALGGSADADFNPSAIGSMFTGFELFEKRGTSTWTLFGNHRMDWTVTEGTLAIAGTITGTIDTSLRARTPTIAVRSTGTIRRDDGLAPAVILRGGATLNNQGLVESTTSRVAVTASGFGNSIFNTGRIQSGGIAIDLSGERDLLNNTGTVQSTSATAAALIMTGRDGSLVNEGLIQGNAEGVRADGAGSAITNGVGGTVIANGVAARVGGNGSVLNQGQIMGALSSSNGLLFTGNGGTAVNRGLIRGYTAVQFDSAAGFVGTLVNEIGATIASTGTAAILGGDGRELITNHGRIINGPGVAIDLRGGDDQMMITSTSDISGRTNGGAGFDTFVVGGSVDSSFNLSTIGPLVDGFEIFRKQGPATWTLRGTGASDWTVDEATLVIQGQVNGTVDTNATAANAFIDVQTTGTVRRDDGRSAVILNGSALLNNAGQVIASTGSNAAVQALGNGNQVTNSGDILSAGFGVQVSGQGNVVSNHGSVRGAGGVAMTGASNAFFNNGFIQAGSGGAAVRALGDSNQITNSGEVRSSGAGFEIGGNANLVTNAGLLEQRRPRHRLHRYGQFAGEPRVRRNHRRRNRGERRRRQQLDLEQRRGSFGRHRAPHHRNRQPVRQPRNPARLRLGAHVHRRQRLDLQRRPDRRHRSGIRAERTRQRQSHHQQRRGSIGRDSASR